MKAVGVYKSLPITDPQSLVDIEIERPIPSRQDLLIQVKALSVNPVDTKRRMAVHEGENTPRILGWDVAGIVVEAGPECTQFKWEFMFTRSMFHTRDMACQQDLLNKLAGLIEEQKIKTTLTELLNGINAANLRKAHAKIEQGNAIGKLVVENFSALV